MTKKEEPKMQLKPGKENPPEEDSVVLPRLVVDGFVKQFFAFLGIGSKNLRKEKEKYEKTVH